MNDPRPIGVFDSGVGGLTVLAEIRDRLPYEHTVYFGDTARVPYGVRDLAEVRWFTFEIINYLIGMDVKLIVIACNTATAAALFGLCVPAPRVVLIALRLRDRFLECRFRVNAEATARNPVTTRGPCSSANRRGFGSAARFVPQSDARIVQEYRLTA